MLTRRVFASRMMIAGLAASSSPSALLAAAGGQTLSPTQRRWMLQRLAQEDRRYDLFAKMLVVPAADAGPRRTAKSGDVHATWPSLFYAAALLESALPERAARAREILRAIIPLQEKDPESLNYGLWPWALEEPFDAANTPEGNGTTFCALPLLMAWMGPSRSLGEDLANEVRDSILHTTRSISRRELHPLESANALVGTSLTLLAAQEFQQAELRTYAKERLRRFQTFLIEQGSFAEYNSPSDSLFLLQEFSRLLLLLKDARDRNRVLVLHDLAWRHVATHFHAPTRQWAGPHSRCRHTDLRENPATLAFLHTACPGLFDFKGGDEFPLPLEAHALPLEVPRKLLKNFSRLDSPRQVVETFVKADPTRSGNKNPVVGTTWLHPRFTIGSINRGDLWSQRRPLLAYWGSAATCRHLRLRVLKNGADDSSALFFSVQHEGALLVAIAFATDYGGLVPALSQTETVASQAGALRLRVEFGGDLKDLTTRSLAGVPETLLIQDRDCRFLLHPIAGAFGGKALRWEAAPAAQLADHIDAFFSGDEVGTSTKIIDHSEAFVCFALREWPYQERKAPASLIDFKREDGEMKIRWNIGGKLLQLTGPLQPGGFAALNDSFQTKITSV